MTPGKGRDAPREPRGKRGSDLGRRLTAARVAAGLTQAQLAEQLGVSVRTIREWELGRTSPRGLAQKALEERIASGFAVPRAAARSPRRPN